MNRLPNIEFTKMELLYFIKNGIISCGNEGIICKYNNKYVIKLFSKFYDMDDPMEGISDNKLEKLKILYGMDLDNIVKIKATVSSSGVVLGYIMPYLDKYYPINGSIISNKNIKDALIKIKNILEYLGRYNIIYGDLHNGNILYNYFTEDICLCDIDNMTVGNYLYDKLSPTFIDYISERGVVDKSLDAYAFNLFALYMILYSKDEFVTRKQIIHELVNNMDNVVSSFSSSYLENNISKRVKRICTSMLNPKEFKGEYII